MNKTIVNRKNDHLQVAQKTNVQMSVTNGLENYNLIYQALPEIDFAEIDTSVVFLGKKLTAPFIISSMTGGTEIAGKINRNLASACQKTGIGMGVGSQRVALEGHDISSFQVRDVAPDILLLANFGAVQLNYGYDVKEATQAIDMIGADALYLHLNPLQEAIQPEGNTNFKNLLSKISLLSKQLEKPLVIKEVGHGISVSVAKILKNAGIKFVETAGAGGTSWAYLEGKRSGRGRLAEVFRNWGVTTADSMINCVDLGLVTIAGGGIRNGLEIAKTLALGASLVSIGMPFLNLAVKDSKAVEDHINQLVLELKITMFCAGARNIKELQSKKVLEKRE